MFQAPLSGEYNQRKTQLNTSTAIRVISYGNNAMKTYQIALYPVHLVKEINIHIILSEVDSLTKKGI